MLHVVSAMDTIPELRSKKEVVDRRNLQGQYIQYIYPETGETADAWDNYCQLCWRRQAAGWLSQAGMTEEAVI